MPLASRNAKRKTKRDATLKFQDPHRPKMPAGSAFWVFLNANREKIKTEHCAGHRVENVSKKAKELWSSMTPEVKAPYEATFSSMKLKHQRQLEEYDANGGVIFRCPVDDNDSGDDDGD
eukprot:TRINITY_DN56691_c0_g1_i1.p1 TRINITY_DN56691_c0_g1~~TRINITY_DN56691_c0_g1_i1.p1  ORF type:complete len:119 (+),score=27.82 TRINITY_DN56691_c0_g1_i1:56-412(+)